MGAHCSLPRAHCGPLHGQSPDPPEEAAAIVHLAHSPKKRPMQQTDSNNISLHPRALVDEPESCALCLQPLSDRHLGVCTNESECRTCSHYFHYSCLRRVKPRRCPQCRTSFDRCVLLPDITENVSDWARLVALCGRDTPSKREILGAMKAMLPLPANQVEIELGRLEPWRKAVDPVTSDFLNFLASAVQTHMPKPLPLSPSVSDDEPDSPHYHMTPLTHANGHRSSDIPGEMCSCGRIHVHRGDRVSRGPAWHGGLDDGGLGQLGTIVREEEAAGAVVVQWDCARYGDVRRYSWPTDPSQHEVVHVPFEQIAPPRGDARDRLQEGSSSASDRRPTRADTELNERPKLFHRCRVLRDRDRVRTWFDMCPPCLCSRPDCRGGVRWNTQAGRHLGREAYVLKIDERDGTILVEMTGRCNCKVWYPALAVEPVYDPDTALQPRFRAGDAVECRIDRDWSRGVVSRVWWRPSTGWGNRPSVPYSIKLRDGRSVFAPKDRDEVIRAADERNFGS